MKVSVLQHKALVHIPPEIRARAELITCCDLVVKDKHGLIDTTIGEHIYNPSAK